MNKKYIYLGAGAAACLGIASVAAVFLGGSKGFVIQNATWAGTDVTAKIQSLVSTTGTIKGPLWTVLGDPTPGQVKALNVTYTYDGTKKTFYWDESEANNVDVTLPM